MHRGGGVGNPVRDDRRAGVREAGEERRTFGGIGGPARAEYPGAFASHTREELLANTRNILWPQIKKALTEALETRERADRSPMTDDSRLTGSYEELQRVFLDSGWTDGLPIALPTEKAVAEFLSFTGRSPRSDWNPT